MNIGIVAVPKAGKSEFARDLGVHLDDVRIVDGYAEQWSERNQIAIGPIGTYIANLGIALERFAWERLARQKHETVISVGTLIETATYTSMQFVATLEVANDDEKLMVTPRIDAVVRMLAVLYQETMQYDHAFYLPPAEGAGDEELFMDRQLQVALASFKLVPVTALLNRDKRVEEALEALHVGD